MALLTIVLLKVTVVLVLFFMCVPAHEARTISHGQNQNIMKNYKDKLIGAVQQGEEAPPYVSNPTSMMSQKAFFVTDHTIDVSPSLRRMLQRGPVRPSGPNPPTHIPPKTSHNAPHFPGSMEKSSPSSSMPKESTSIP
ncbi:hypothetical protein CMV_022365 [Castanea mollissima]|uniref:Uncharacterized protein n=1 Tax=Castanea mollissima TaxID=60419 RepID=A0A8J4QIG7_9ROSI|nr:hypothetical protein CMV_022365 [Castanea mollissima]